MVCQACAELKHDCPLLNPVSDTLRTHVKGVLTRNPSWESALADFQAESSWIVGDWTDVQQLVERTTSGTPAVALARVLLSMRSGDEAATKSSLSNARFTLGNAISAAGANGYRRSYDSVINLHLLHELELFSQTGKALPSASRQRRGRSHNVMTELSRTLAARLESTLPSFRTREPILSLRRTATRFL
jgi:serine/threonine-protein kinase ATR